MDYQPQLAGLLLTSINSYIHSKEAKCDTGQQDWLIFLIIVPVAMTNTLLN